jgi:hypothetical protein
MPRALKNHDISLGLATIPVQLVTAASSQGVAFHLLHARCGSRMQMRLECPIHGIVPREETVKGYEIAKDEYVRFESEELKALEQASSSALVIDSFVPEGAIDRSTLRTPTISVRAKMVNALSRAFEGPSEDASNCRRHVHLAREDDTDRDPGTSGRAPPPTALLRRRDP